jgi:hypothetical protein
MLEKVNDFEANGVRIPASRLGYRITMKFVRRFLARVFDNPSKVFSEDILKPELQDPVSYADGILQIAEAQRRVALLYMEDGGYEIACPPLRAVLSVMAHGHYEGKGLNDPEIRQLFTRESLLSSQWYRRRLEAKQRRDIQHWQDMIARVKSYIDDPSVQDFIGELDLPARLHFATNKLDEAKSPAYLDSLVGTIGVDPLQPSMKDKVLVDRLAEVS